jgi:predicted NAD/FAD-dependent oxidoreductase
MIIAVIGAGISGLTAGSLLAKAGHHVTVFEKSKGFGGRLSTRYAGDAHDVKLDHGAPFLPAGGEEYTAWLDSMIQAGVLAAWTDSVAFHDGSQFYSEHPNRERERMVIAPKGMNSLGQYLGRYVDVVRNKKVGGITLVAPGHKRKRSWVVNFDDSSVFEADAVIVATPGPQAQGIIQTSQDEWGIKFLIRQLSDVVYESAYTLMAGYGDRAQPDWKAIACQNDILSFVSNERSKRPDSPETTLVVQSTSDFAQAMANAEPEEVQKAMVNALSNVAGSWSGFPLWTQSHFWRYYRCVAPIEGMSFLELEQSNAPLAVVGDYIGGTTVESAYLSGKRLAEHWIATLAR